MCVCVCVCVCMCGRVCGLDMDVCPVPIFNNSKKKIGQLPLETTAEDLKTYFLTFGDVTDAIIMPDSNTGKSRGFFIILNNLLVEMEKKLS